MQRINLRLIAQCAVVVLAALALKQYYSTASADDLRWILAPTTALVEAVTGTAFSFESGAGYMSGDRSFLIAPSCAGVNFLIAAFLVLSAGRLLSNTSRKQGWGFIPAGALVAYLATLAANAVRIATALRMRHVENSLLTPTQLHRIEGIVVYFGFLLLLFVASERVSFGSRRRFLRRSLIPLLVYYGAALGIPLANGGYRQGSGFWEHATFVLLIPALLVLSFAMLGRRRAADADNAENRRSNQDAANLNRRGRGGLGHFFRERGGKMSAGTPGNAF